MHGQNAAGVGWSPADLSAKASLEPQHQHMLGREIGTRDPPEEWACIFPRLHSRQHGYHNVTIIHVDFGVGDGSLHSTLLGERGGSRGAELHSTKCSIFSGGGWPVRRKPTRDTVSHCVVTTHTNTSSWCVKKRKKGKKRGQAARHTFCRGQQAATQAFVSLSRFAFASTAR